MAEEKRVLIVDDHYDTLRFLRTMLEMADERFKVTSVLSGEEAGLELRQPYDLLITDIKLPGVDGIQVAKRARRLSPEMPVIVVSGFAKEIIRLEAADFDIFRAFRKPLIAEEVMEAVYLAIFGEPPAPPEPELPEIVEEVLVAAPMSQGQVETTAVAKTVEIDPSVPAEVHRRLELLRANTGAEELMLATMNGDISAKSGFLDINLPLLAQTLASNMRGSFALADQLGDDGGHQSIQYHSTGRFDLYIANVGEYHFVTMFFDATKIQRGRIGTVWVFIQRAIKDLEPLLAQVKVKKLSEPSPPPASAKPAPKVREEFVHAAAITRDEDAVVKEEKPAIAPAFYVPPPMVELEPLSEADMAKLAALEVSDDEAVDDFWDTAVGDIDIDEPLTSGVTLEEALRQGILPSEIAEDSPLAALIEEQEQEQAAATFDPSQAQAHGLAPAHDIPASLLADADDPNDFTLDLGPLDDGDDFDLSGMPGFDDLPPNHNEPEADKQKTAPPRQLNRDDMAKLADLQISDTAENDEVEAFWNALMTGDTRQGTRTDGLTFEAALEQGLEIEEKVEAKQKPISAKLSDLEKVLSVEDDDADSFWEEIAADAPDLNVASGMSLEEAMRKGLIPSDFSLDAE